MGTPQKQKQQNPVVRFANRLRKSEEKFRRSLPDHVDVERFIDVAQTAILNNPDLVDADHDTLYAAFKRCAQSGLMPDGEEAAIIPYRGRARFQMMVQGVTRLMLRSPNVVSVDAEVVLKSDEHFDYGHGLDPFLEHKPERGPDVRPEPENLTHVYAVATKIVDGHKIRDFVVLTKADVEAARDEADYSESGPWVKWYGEMAKKTAIHRLAKKMDLAPEARRAITTDIAENYGGPEPTEFGTSAEEKIESRSETRHGEIRGRLVGEQAGKAPTDGSENGSPESPDAPGDSPEGDSDGVDATDAAIDLADEHGIDVADLAPGSGKNGRVIKPDVDDEIERIGDEAGEPTGDAARDEKESQEASPAGEWPDVSEMDRETVLRHIAKVVRKMESKLDDPGCWTFPTLADRIATTLYQMDEDVPRDEDGAVPAADLGVDRLREMAGFLHDAVDAKLEDGTDPMLVDIA